MAFGMEHYFHHKYHSHAEGAHGDEEDEVTGGGASKRRRVES